MDCCLGAAGPAGAGDGPGGPVFPAAERKRACSGVVHPPLQDSGYCCGGAYWRRPLPGRGCQSAGRGGGNGRGGVRSGGGGAASGAGFESDAGAEAMRTVILTLLSCIVLTVPVRAWDIPQELRRALPQEAVELMGDSHLLLLLSLSF